MKRFPNTLITLTALIGASASVSNAAILLEDFEDSTVTYVTSNGEFHDGLSDYFSIVDPTNPLIDANTGIDFAGFGGSQYFAAEDIDDGGTRPATQTLTFTVNIFGYENISFSSLFAAGGNDDNPAYDDDDGFLVTATIDGGVTQNLLAFEAIGGGNTLLREDTDFSGFGDSTVVIDHNFESYSSPIIGTGSELELVITVRSNDGNGEFAFDNVTLDGDFVIPEPSSALLAFLGSAFLLGRRRK